MNFQYEFRLEFKTKKLPMNLLNSDDGPHYSYNAVHYTIYTFLFSSPCRVWRYQGGREG